MTWFLLAMFATSVTVIPVASKAQCELLRAEILNGYGRGSGLVDVRCIASSDQSPATASPPRRP